VFIGGEQGPFAKTFSGMIHKFFVAFIPIFVAIDPIGLVAMFMGLAGNASREHRQREGFIGIFTALCVSVGFVFLGKIIFTALGITVADFQVAGGLILLGLAGRELLNISPADREATNDFGVVPLGMPLIAGPALLTALLIGRYGGADLYAVLHGGQSRPCRGRILECRSGCALDGQTRPARCLKNRSAPPGCHRRQFDQTRVAGSVSAPTGSRSQRLRTDIRWLPSVAIAVELRCAL